MKPIIGITSMLSIKPKKNYNVISQNYIDSVIRGGGIPIIIPQNARIKDIPDYLSRIDGLVLSGGEDVAPFIYGENIRREVDYILPQRDFFELELLKEAIRRNIPILGICRGMQILNVCLGGTLYQDIKTQLENKMDHLPELMPVNQLYHTITIHDHTILRTLFKEKILSVNSFHHQCIKDLGRDVIVSALAEDGIIEGIEVKGNKNIIGIQCHPEDLTEEYPKFVVLFRYIVERAKKQ